jgi:hypothetical protein
MSNLLSEAIVDAKVLRTAALKNAETMVIEKYSQEVKKTLDRMLEQDDLDLELGGEMGAETADEPAMDFSADEPAMPEEELGAEEGSTDPLDREDNIPLAATDGFNDLSGDNLRGFPAQGAPVEMNIDLGALQEALQNLEEAEEVEVDLSELLDDEEIEEVNDPGSFAGEEADEEGSAGDSGAAALAGSAAAEEADSEAMKNAGLEEDKKPDDDDANAPPWADKDDSDASVKEENLDSLVDAIAEKLTVDMGATLSGWAGRSSESMKWEIEKALAHRRSTEVQEELDTLRKAQEELVFENNQFNEQNSQYKHAIEELKESLQDVNLSNARLLYTNRVLRNTSLNERQKDKIVEAISNAGSVAEAKMIHETLQSTVEAAPTKRGPKSLSEAIGSRSSVIRATRHESPLRDPFQDRMKRLAGIE